MKPFSKKTVFLIAALILIAAFGLAFLHSHAGGEEHDCSICRLVQTFGLLFAAAFVAFVADLTKARTFVPVKVLSYKSRLSSSKLRDRAPPFLK